MYLSLQIHDSLPFGLAADRLDYARQIIRAEAAALDQVAGRLEDSFLQAVDLIFHCAGRVGITGVGKSADIGQKLAGTLNSTGTRAYVLDVTRAMHGDLGMVHPDDVMLVLSYSGESDEIVRLLGPLRPLVASVIALTGNRHSTLAHRSDVAVVLGPVEETCPLGMAPSTSTTAMIAVGDALAFLVSRMRRFNQESFARFHPAGSLGRKLIKVDAVMRRAADLRLASCDDTVRAVFSRVSLRGRRTGAVMLADATGRLCGLFTDSDLARLFEKRLDSALDRPIREVMSGDPITVQQGTRLLEALEIMRHHKISELPVINDQGAPAGLLDITDLIGVVPMDETETVARVA